jgi:mRNA interferase RelE/StbE
MRYEIILAPEAVVDLNAFKAKVRAEVRDGIEKYLRYEPKKASKSRIKRLRGLLRPQYRLRVGSDVRVFYDVEDQCLEILAVVSKSNAENWLKENGVVDEENCANGS